MKITKKILDKFNPNKWACANDNWNIAYGYPTIEQHAFLKKVHTSKYGICGGHNNITMKDIKEYNQIHGV